ncbi:hypothetical protein GUITHDRAFT_74499 [Guillardia theta CCMP2712]|uniref:dihydropyrimidinase n=1 Tax=Guillardia theta (strain CCMP2712) TaxID=905079 RepID=L1J0Q6_GUITC|nr:hypothetical protein GUITHDRAFT_74499 [Guillardia theta CCMP2712]EKX41719.1 hypothetical protein GUITHDRAFT_74499 [Guillardia theta CCMP2712]|eukprot:XP_005828699.1 hypothetical protein GUITHDRAFT_74499 [Guillardia theta CCMP2712]
MSRELLTTSLRCIPLLRSNKDIAVIPGGHESTREFAEFCKEVLTLKDEQIVYTDDQQRSFNESLGNFTDSVKDRVLSFASKSQDEEWLLIPFSITSRLRDLEVVLKRQLGTKNIKIVGESKEWMSRFGNRGVIHRHVSDLDKLSIIEELGLDITVPRGFTCSDDKQLLVAFRLLTDGDPNVQVVIKPILSSGQGMLFYDFPYGDVILQEYLQVDRSPDGMHVSPTVQYMQNDLLDGRPCERIIMGSMTYGLRSCTATQEFMDKISQHSSRLVEAIAPSGMGAFAFTSVDGKPYLTDAHAGTLCMEHFTKLFHEMYAKDARFCSWNFYPHPGMDVWTLWTRLCDRNIAFMPGKSKRGVFPLLFLKNTTATLISIGVDDADVSLLRSQAEHVMRLVDLSNKIESVALSENRRQLWIQSPRPEYKLVTQRYNLPNRCIGLLRPGVDVIVLPGGHEPTREFWSFMKDVLDLGEDQVIFSSGDSYCLDDDINETILSRLRSIIQSSGNSWTLVPYMVTSNFQRWACQLADLDVSVFGEDLEWVQKFGSKGILHRHVRSLDTPSIIEEIDPNIRVARGYGCSTVDDLVEAYKLLDCKEVVIKPVFGAAGEGIIFCSELEQLKMYDFPMGDVCLEEFLDLDKAPDGLVLSPAMHYNEGVLIGKGLVDQIMVGTSYMGWRKSGATKVFQKTANRYMQNVIQATKPRGPGGVDFLSVNGLPVLSDINTGRFNGAHFPKLFQARYAPDSSFYCWKTAPALDFDVYAFWSRLVSNGIAFIPGKSTRGIFPLLFLRGLSGLYVAFGDTNEEAEALDEHACMALHDKANNLLKPSVPPLPVVSQQMQSRFKLTLIKNAEAIFAPEVINAKHILVGGTQLHSFQSASPSTGWLICPSPFPSRPLHPPRPLPSLLPLRPPAGLTTVVGVLGTDCVSRSLENLLTKCRGLNEDGITAYMWTGAYRIPAPNITGSVRRDICLLEQCIGVGECAISDHRGSQPSSERILDVASDCRVGGLLSGKAGVMYCHMGFGDGLLQPLWKAMKESDIPITTFLPTHMERSEALIEDGARWIRKGGYVDFTCRTVKARLALRKYHQEGLPMDHVMVSSDSYGSLPSFDDDGNLVRYTYGHPKAFLQFIWKMYFQEQWPLDRILPLVTKNPAKFLKLKGKGEISVGSDADVLLLDKNTLKLKSVLAKGEVMMTPKWVHQGMFGTPNPEKVGSKPKRSHSFNNNTSCC